MGGTGLAGTAIEARATDNLEILLSRLLWPSPMVRERAAVALAELVAARSPESTRARKALLAWIGEQARRQGCDSVELDSGVGAERQDAHRRYFDMGMRIASFHFTWRRSNA